MESGTKVHDLNLNKILMDQYTKVDQISLTGATFIDDKLKERWKSIEAMDNVFRYKIPDVKKFKILPGNLHLLVEYNPDRTTLRRKPQILTSITQKFNENEFNFNKINEKEILFVLVSKLGAVKVTILINNSPLTKYHCLLVPRLKDNQPQILTKEAMFCAVDLLQSLNDKCFRIGYNSSGALASVNHLHLHLLHIEQQLFIEDTELQHLVKHIYRISDKCPVKGYCFLLNESMDNIMEILSDMDKLIEYFCAEIIPHNVFCTWGNAIDDVGKVLKIFIFPRDKMAVVKEFSSFNIAFCELSGFIPVGNAQIFDEITEDLVVGKIQEISGNIMPEIENNIIRLYLTD